MSLFLLIRLPFVTIKSPWIPTVNPSHHSSNTFSPFCVATVFNSEYSHDCNRIPKAFRSSSAPPGPVSNRSGWLFNGSKEKEWGQIYKQYIVQSCLTSSLYLPWKKWSRGRSTKVLNAIATTAFIAKTNMNAIYYLCLGKSNDIVRLFFVFTALVLPSLSTTRAGCGKVMRRRKENLFRSRVLYTGWPFFKKFQDKSLCKIVYHWNHCQMSFVVQRDAYLQYKKKGGINFRSISFKHSGPKLKVFGVFFLKGTALAH